MDDKIRNSSSRCLGAIIIRDNIRYTHYAGHPDAPARLNYYKIILSLSISTNLNKIGICGAGSAQETFVC